MLVNFFIDNRLWADGNKLNKKKHGGAVQKQIKTKAKSILETVQESKNNRRGSTKIMAIIANSKKQANH